jgi:Spy/CpxP family protein refolding chaperone
MVSLWKPIAAAVVIFSAGFATGNLMAPLRSGAKPKDPAWDHEQRFRPFGPGARRPEMPGPRDWVEKLATELNLTAIQRERIEALLKESQERMKAMADEMAPRTREEFHRTRELIRKELTPDQQSKYDALQKERQNRMRRGVNEPGGPPSPGGPGGPPAPPPGPPSAEPGKPGR